MRIIFRNGIMKPKDLKNPFPWNKREVFLDENQKILYIPERCERKNLTEKLTGFFNEFDGVYIEYCSGNGEWIHKKAIENPNVLWIAVEKQFKRVRKIWSKAQNSNLKNLFIVCGEALEFSKHYLNDDKIDQVFINFPDPWPKNKHAKFRLIQEPFIQELYRILKLKGEITFLTDDENYSKSSIFTFLEKKQFQPLFEKPYYQSDLNNYGSSYFLRLWEEKKRSFYFSKFQKTCKD